MPAPSAAAGERCLLEWVLTIHRSGRNAFSAAFGWEYRRGAALRVRGYRFFFFSLEEHEPPHVHIANAERYAKFWLQPVSLADVRGFRANEMAELRKIVTKNARFLLERWYEYFGREN